MDWQQRHELLFLAVICESESAGMFGFPAGSWMRLFRVTRLQRAPTLQTPAERLLGVCHLSMIEVSWVDVTQCYKMPNLCSLDCDTKKWKQVV